MLKRLRDGCVVQFLSNYTFCEYFKDLNEKYTKGNDDVLSLFLLQLLGTQIGLESVGLWNRDVRTGIKLIFFVVKNFLWLDRPKLFPLQNWP